MSKKTEQSSKIAYMRISSSTNSRTTISSYLRGFPAGDSVFFFVPNDNIQRKSLLGAGLLSSLVLDVVLRQRLGGLNMSEFVMVEAPLPNWDAIAKPCVTTLLLLLNLPSRCHALEWISLLDSRQRPRKASEWKSSWAVSPLSRLETKAAFDAVATAAFGLERQDVLRLIDQCDFAVLPPSSRLNPKGFWRVDKDKPPELRHTVLTLVAFHDLQQHIDAAGGDRDAGIESFLNQNDGEGWLLPETLRLADYGLGHDERAKEHQPVTSRLGPRFYDWQLAQGAEESWRECHLHARNLLGEAGYQKLLADIEAEKSGELTLRVAEPEPPAYGEPARERGLFD